MHAIGPYLAKRPPLVPGLQATKSFRNDLSLDCQQNGRFPSRACMMVGGWDRAKPLPSSSEWAPNIWNQMIKTSKSMLTYRTQRAHYFLLVFLFLLMIFMFYWIQSNLKSFHPTPPYQFDKVVLTSWEPSSMYSMSSSISSTVTTISWKF